MKYKLFCDESNYLLNDPSNLMVNGAIRIEESRVIEANKFIKYLRHKHSYHTEIKWTKLIAKQFDFYKELIDYFFQADFLSFKATLVMNKSNIDHGRFNRDHNEFYYVVYYYTLRDLLRSNSQYKIYFDYKDTLGGRRVTELSRVLANSGFSNTEFTIIHSHESQLIQLCDLFVGAIGYANRQDIPKESNIKNKIVDYLNERIKSATVSYGTIEGTKPWEEKFNIFRWSLASV